MRLFLLAVLVTCVCATPQYTKSRYSSGVKGGYSSGSGYQAGENFARYYNNTQPGYGGYNSRFNQTGTATLDYEKGVCYVEVPTATIAKDPSHIPAGNGSRADLSRIRTCCKGYIRNIHNFRICDPVCTNDCINALCTEPEVCTCFPQHVKNVAGICVPTCPIGCQNGVCAGGECLCKDGYRLDSDSKYCIPICRDNCGGIGNCTAPNTCECRKGYSTSPDGSCKPHCDRCGTNSQCVAPNECRCLPGYKTNPQGDCFPQCANNCLPNGRCVGPNKCDYPLTTTTTIAPIGLHPQGPHNVPQNPNSYPYPSQYYPGYQQSNYPGNQQSNYGNQQTNYPGGQQSNYPGGQQPNYPGYQQTNYPGNQQSQYPVIQPGQTNQPGHPYQPGQSNQPGHFNQTGSSYNQHSNNYPTNRPAQEQQTNNPNNYQPIYYNPGQQQNIYPGSQHSYNDPQRPNYPNSQQPNSNQPSNNANYPSSPYNPTNQHSYPSNQHYYPQYPTQQQGTSQLYNQSYSSSYTSQQQSQVYPDSQVESIQNLCSKPCLNGICIGRDTCICNNGYVLDESDQAVNSCKPHCPGGCPNGICSSPNFCICDMGYYKDHSVKGKANCVKRIRRSADVPDNEAEPLVFEIEPEYELLL